VLTKRKWAIYLPSTVLLLGVFLIPFGMPVFSLDSYLKNDYPYEKREMVSGGQYNVRFEERYSKEKWAETLNELKAVYDSLSQIEKKNTLVWGKHYGQAGAVNLFGKRHDLPNAFSLHGSFYNWTPKGEMPTIIIALGYNVGNFFQGYFDEVTKVKTIYNPYSENEEELHQHIYICKKPKQTFDELKELFKDRIFE